MITKKQLEEWRKLAQESTDGPWTVWSDDHEMGQYHVAEHLGDDIAYVANAKFIAASREAVPLLLDAVEKLTEALKFYRDGLNRDLVAYNCLSQVYAPEGKEEECLI